MDIEFYDQFSDTQLMEFHNAIRQALVDDDERAAANLFKKYGVREYVDFGEQRDILENLLTRRRLRFEPIPF